MPRTLSSFVVLTVGVMLLGCQQDTSAITRLKDEVRMGMTPTQVEEIAQISPTTRLESDGYLRLSYVRGGARIAVQFVGDRAVTMLYEPPNSEEVQEIFSQKRGIPDADGTLTLPDDPKASSPYPGR